MMLSRLGEKTIAENTSCRIADAQFPQVFPGTLEFNAPARGPWNIVHTGMLLPESHQIFACARGCLRGVILTAAEMNAMDRMSFVVLEENDLFNGRLETSIIEGTAHILKKMPHPPRVVLLFLSCVQLFAGIDFPYLLAELEKKFPQIRFIDCCMNPTMRKSGLTPDQLMRKQLYAPLEECAEEPAAVTMLGNDRPTDPQSELFDLLRKAGCKLLDITACKTFEEYRKLAAGKLFLCYNPPGHAGAEHLAKRLNRKYLYLPLSYDYGEIAQNWNKLADALQVPAPDMKKLRDEAESMLSRARNLVGDLPVAIDYTATPRPLGLARLLLEHKFAVKKVYLDVISPEEEADFDFLQKKFPDLVLQSTLHPAMRFAAKPERKTLHTLGIGQKAAYFSGTDHFVNIVSGGGFYGFRGIVKLAGQMIDAVQTAKDLQSVISLKGLGCESCLK